MKKMLLAVMIMFGLVVASPAVVSAQSTPTTDTTGAKKSLCEGVGITGGSCDDPSSGSSVAHTITVVINVFSWIVGLIAVIMIIIGGLKYITSAGDSNSINSAKNTILYAVVGLIVVALAQVLVLFVINKASSAAPDASASAGTSQIGSLEAPKPDMV